MLNNNKATSAEIIAIIETYEGLLRQGFTKSLLEEWTAWKARLCALEGR